MSTGETPTTPRFTSPSSTTTKKYPGTPKSPLVNNSNATNTNTNNNNRNSLARQRLLSSKISAPRPMNLPSLRREHAAGTEVPASSPSTTSHGWGSSTSSSPSNSFTQQEIPVSPEQPISPTIESTQDVDQKVDPPPTTTRAWNVPTKTTTTTNQSQSTDFPTAAEAAAGKSNEKPLIYDDKEYLKYASHDPNHTSWDEMVSEDLDDFSVDVVEFDDGTKVQIEDTKEKEELVNPSDRFTEDYDRSYPPQQQQQKYSSYRRSTTIEDHGYNNSRYNHSVHGGGSYDHRRHSNTTTTTTTNDHHHNKWIPRRESMDSNNSQQRRSSYDRNVLQRPRRLSEQSFKSDHSREDTFHFEQHTVNPLHIIPEPPLAEEITAVQKEVMLTAAERAKKRRDEEEAEFEAARVRARQKADALAEKARLLANNSVEVLKKPTIEEEKKKKKRDSVSSSSTSTQPTSSSLPDTSKPWNLVAAKKEITIEKRPESISAVKEDTSSLIVDHQPKPKPSLSESIVEIFEYNDMEDMDTISSHIKHKGQYRGWTRHDEEHGGRGERHHGRGRGTTVNTRGGTARTTVHTRRQSENTTNWRQQVNAIENEKEPITVVTEILKHEPVVPTTVDIKESKKTRLINLLKESSSPIFPEAIQKLVGKKPANISFMIDSDESDKDITMMNVEEHVVPKVAHVERETVAKVTKDKALEEVETTNVPEAVDETSATSSTTSTPPRTQFQQQKQQNGHIKLDSSSSPRKLSMNPNFPVLVYQYPISQQQQQMSETSSHSNGYHSRSKGLRQQQQRPMGVYLMPPHQYISSNQYMVPYPQVGTTGVQPVYYPTMSWPTQQYNNNSRPSFEQQRRSYNASPPSTNNGNTTTTSHMSEWEAISNSSGYQSLRFAHSFPNSQHHRGSSYRGGKRGGGGKEWFNNNNSNHRGGRGGHYQSKRHSQQQDVNNTATDL